MHAHLLWMTQNKNECLYLSFYLCRHTQIVTMCEENIEILLSVHDISITCIRRILIRLWYFLMGQYFPRVREYEREDELKIKKESKLFSLLFVIKFIVLSFLICVTLNTFPTVMLFINYVKCSTRYYHVCYSIVLHGKTDDSNSIPDIVLRDTYNLTSSDTQDDLTKFEEISKGVLLLTSLSSTISYMLFQVVLGKLYVWPHCKNIFKKWNPAEKTVKNEEPLHPFNDDERDNNTTTKQDDNTTTQLSCKEACYYTGILILTW